MEAIKPSSGDFLLIFRLISPLPDRNYKPPSRVILLHPLFVNVFLTVVHLFEPSVIIHAAEKSTLLSQSLSIFSKVKGQNCDAVTVREQIP